MVTPLCKATLWAGPTAASWADTSALGHRAIGHRSALQQGCAGFSSRNFFSQVMLEITGQWRQKIS
jgi:hypothetical protein